MRYRTSSPLQVVLVPAAKAETTTREASTSLSIVT